jgi:hypothetical protein
MTRASLGIASAWVILAVMTGCTNPDIAGLGHLERHLVNGAPDSDIAGVGAFVRAGQVVCSGSLIAPTAVLTAASCLESTEGLRFYVGADIEGSGSLYTIETTAIHSHYDRDTGAHDIGVAVLADPVGGGISTFTPHSATLSAFWEGSDVRAVGFGATGPSADDSGRRRSASLSIDAVADHTFDSSSSAAACPGDTGGSMLVETEGIWEIIGVVSPSDTPCVGVLTSTRVDVHLEFVEGFVETSGFPEPDDPSWGDYGVPDMAGEMWGASDMGSMPDLPGSYGMDFGMGTEMLYDAFEDICEVQGWYDDGVCDQCPQPDPDCEEQDAGSDRGDAGSDDAEDDAEDTTEEESSSGPDPDDPDRCSREGLYDNGRCDPGCQPRDGECIVRSGAEYDATASSCTQVGGHGTGSGWILLLACFTLLRRARSSRPRRKTVLLLMVGALLGCNATEKEPICLTAYGDFYLDETVIFNDTNEVCVCQASGTLECGDEGQLRSRDLGRSDMDAGSVDGGNTTPETGSEGSDSGSQSNDGVISDCLDEDADGFYTCVDGRFADRSTTIDCDDGRWLTQPGGYDFPDNGIDDDCDGEIDETSAGDCATGPNPHRLAFLAGMDLTEYIVGSERTGHGRQFSVRNDYFGITPREGLCLAVLSTGEADTVPLSPDDMYDMYDAPTDGTQPGVAFSERSRFDDPATEDPGRRVWDLAQLTVELAPPSNAAGFQFDVMFMSAEFPEFLCQTFNDTFYAIAETEALNDGEPTNIAFDGEGDEVTVNFGYFEHPSGWSTDLSQTPYGVSDSMGECFPESRRPSCTLPDYCNTRVGLRVVGSGTGWLTAQSPIVAGESAIRLTFSIHDEGDAILDSAVLLDNFQWLSTTPEEGLVKD